MVRLASDFKLPPLINLQQITGYDLRWQLDCPEADLETHMSILDVYSANPHLFFAASNGIQIFGAPRSQQEAKRFWSLWGNLNGEASRMSPILGFDLPDQDVTCQLNVDMIASGHGNRKYGKVDLSNT
ncbi:MAG: hypothetical protein HY986_01860 [Candidatus Melainabacteria bacterium]|nr:hypothetical protein [Candidatus Melainabacteria bacterium]